MKKTLAILALSLGITSWAHAANSDDGFTILQNGSLGVAPLAAKGFSLEWTKCPHNAACLPVAQLKLDYELTGCSNLIGPVSLQVAIDSRGHRDIYVSAIEIVKVNNIMCKKAPSVSAYYILGDHPGSITEADISIHNLDQLARTDSN